MVKNIQTKNIILYAEDDEDDQQLIKDSLEKYAHNVEIVIHNNGVEALSYLNHLSPEDPAPCLIILDINMPKMNGIEALKQIRKNPRFTKVPAILFTTSSQQLDKKFAAEYKAGFITKPVDTAQMKYIVETFIKYCDIK
jgi:CheY-like chemotaxis protein